MAGKKCPIYYCIKLCCCLVKSLLKPQLLIVFFIREFSSDASGHKCNNVFLKIIKFEANALQNKILITLILCSDPKY